MKTKTVTYYMALYPHWHTWEGQKPGLFEAPPRPDEFVGCKRFEITVKLPCFPEPDGTIEAQAKEIKP